jgi:hypothetical protein
LPLAGVSFDPKGSEHGSIDIMAGTEATNHVTHVITHPKRVYHKTGTGDLSSEVERDEVVEVTAAGDPPVTYIRFLSAAESS